MHRLALTAALLSATPALAQNTSPFQGALPNTVILDDGWQMTPQADRCVLTHHADGPGQDLVILEPKQNPHMLLGIILPGQGAYTSPVQLTVMARTSTVQQKQIGRATFSPSSGALGTLLTTFWPADRLLPWLTSADRLTFYDAAHRLVTSVRLAGAPAAVASLRGCLSNSTRQANPTP